MKILKFGRIDANKNSNITLLRLFVSILFFLLLYEGIIKILVLNEGLFTNWLSIFLLLLTISLFVSMIYIVLPTKIQRIFIYTFYSFITLYSFVQIFYFHLMKNFLSFGLAGMNGNIFDFIDDALSYFEWKFLWLLLPLVISSLLDYYFNIFTTITRNFKYVSTSLVLVLVSYGMNMFLISGDYFRDSYSSISDIDLYKSLKFQQLSISKFGLVKYLELDTIYSVFPQQINENNSLDIESQVSEEVFKEVVSVDKNRSFDDTSWILESNEESNEVIKEIDQYLMNRTITPKNNYTGLFEGKNLILIMAEAFDQSAINPEIAPTIYKMASEGILHRNHYSPMYSCATGESEFISMTSLVPVANTCTPNTFKDNLYPNSLGSLFKRDGYYISSYHSWKDEWYERNTLHPNYGFTYYDFDKLNLKGKTGKGWPSDYELFKAAIPHFIEEDPFFSFVITTSGHFSYNDDFATIKKNISKVNHLDVPYELQKYYATQVELNLGIEYLIEQLDEEGILEDTVIALFGDHYPFKLSVNDLNILSPYNDRTKDLNANNVPFLIWTPGIEKMEVTKITDTFDILPTLANMFDLNYDPRYYLGSDTMSDESGLAIFANGSWISDDGWYNAPKASYITSANSKTDAEVKNTNVMIENYFKVSEKILRNDYFKVRYSLNN